MGLIDLPDWVKDVGLGLVAAAVLAGGITWYQQHLVNQGRAAADVQHALADAVKERTAAAALAQANGKIAVKQAALDAAVAALSDTEKELHAQQTQSAALQRDLASGRVRVSVAARCPAGGAAGADPTGAAAGLDPAGGQGTATLDPAVASDLEWARQTRNDALTALQACIVSYDSAKVATD